MREKDPIIEEIRKLNQELNKFLLVDHSQRKHQVLYELADLLRIKGKIDDWENLTGEDRSKAIANCWAGLTPDEWQIVKLFPTTPMTLLINDSSLSKSYSEQELKDIMAETQKKVSRLVSQIL